MWSDLRDWASNIAWEIQRRFPERRGCLEEETACSNAQRWECFSHSQCCKCFNVLDTEMYHQIPLQEGLPPQLQEVQLAFYSCHLLRICSSIENWLSKSHTLPRAICIWWLKEVVVQRSGHFDLMQDSERHICSRAFWWVSWSYVASASQFSFSLCLSLLPFPFLLRVLSLIYILHPKFCLSFCFLRT